MRKVSFVPVFLVDKTYFEKEKIKTVVSRECCSNFAVILYLFRQYPSSLATYLKLWTDCLHLQRCFFNQVLNYSCPDFIFTPVRHLTSGEVKHKIPAPPPQGCLENEY